MVNFPPLIQVTQLFCETVFENILIIICFNSISFYYKMRKRKKARHNANIIGMPIVHGLVLGLMHK